MNYSQLEFLRLMEEVEFQNGVHLDRDCVPSTFRMKSKPNGPERTYETSSCGNTTMFQVPYAQEDKGGVVTHAAVTVCAVDDDMGLWPRFAHALKGDNE